MSNLPNQLTYSPSGNQLIAGTGISIRAEAAITGSTPQVARQEGIFFTHKPVDRKFIAVPYAPASMPVSAIKAGGDDSHTTKWQRFNIKNPQITASSFVTWNEKELIFNVSVQDPGFYISHPGRDFAEAGLEILIDPARKRAPHPGDSILFFVVPLKGTPYRTDFTAEVVDGVFRLGAKPARIDYTYNVRIDQFKGYDIKFSVPREAFGRSIPDTVGCNLVLRMFDDAGQIQKIALDSAQNNKNEFYSPFVWWDYCREPKPFHMNAALQLIVFPALGFFLALLAYAVIIKMRKPQLLSNFERSEEEKNAFEQVNAVVEQDLVKKDLTIDQVAQRCKMDPKALNSLVKRNTGFSFANYLQFCRTEVAKERLRSSRSSEKSIADLCGFSSAMEMEKCFSKFHHITPYKFRSQQQVA
jgi:AraC-like DNA-binding protein